MAFEEEFAKLDEYLESITHEYPIVGTPLKVIANIKGNGYTTPYYFISTFDDIFDDIFEIYLANPHITSKELRGFFDKNPIEGEGLVVGIELYMSETIGRASCREG